MTMITRVGFCEKCQAKGNPKRGQLYLFFSTHNIFKIGTIKSDSSIKNKGITPHIYESGKIDRNSIEVKKICCIEGCGSHTIKSGDEEILCLKEGNFIKEKMLIKNWNALVKFVKSGFKF